MGAIGIGLVWGSYTLGLWAWCLVTGRNVSMPQLLSFTTWPPGAVSTQKNTNTTGTSGGATKTANNQKTANVTGTLGKGVA